MSKLPRGRWAALMVAVVGLVGLIALVQRFTPSQEGETTPALSVHSSREGGARALYLWLSDLGYRTSSLEFRPFDVDRSTRVLFVLAPTDNPSEAEASRVVAWVEQGGNLVLVADRPNRLLERLGIEIAARQGTPAEAVPVQPLFGDPPLGGVAMGRGSSLRPVAGGWVPLLGAPEPGGPVVAAVATVGRGRALVLADRRPLSNGGIDGGEGWRLVTYALAGLPAGSAIVFDEYHHGLTEHGTLGAQLLREPWGWAILYALALLFAYVAARGRRFGRAISAERAGFGRTREEYVATLAALLREGRHREWLRRQFVAQTKRALGARFRVRSDLPAAEFVAALAAQRSEASTLADPLARLEAAGQLGDAAVLALVREVHEVQATLIGS